MREKGNMILVDTSVLPDVFEKILETKKIIQTGEASSINAAVKKTGISRSAFYKYKDAVFPFDAMTGVVTFAFELKDVSGVLSEILSVIAKSGYNILTINQNIPIGGTANMTISVRTSETGAESVLKIIKEIKGVKKAQILAREENF